ncbi:hypothetical protein UF75_2337 [Desulfosporosinus sp. I2]|nr:hypothetical protein UF75_2337 [Desulfosporosinus sp. I2]
MEGLRLSSDGMAVGYHEGKATFMPGLLPEEIGQVYEYYNDNILLNSRRKLCKLQSIFAQEIVMIPVA